MTRLRTYGLMLAAWIGTAALAPAASGPHFTSTNVTTFATPFGYREIYPDLANNDLDRNKPEVPFRFYYAPIFAPRYRGTESDWEAGDEHDGVLLLRLKVECYTEEYKRLALEAVHDRVLLRAAFPGGLPRATMEALPVKECRVTLGGGHILPPGVRLTWSEAMGFCAKLTERERAANRLPADWAYRLPTEAEREYAARAETTLPFAVGNNGTGSLGLTPQLANAGNAVGATVPVTADRYPANAWGLRQMHGNVWEWCLDWYRPELPGGIDPLVASPVEGQFYRVLRGGSFRDLATTCRSARRGCGVPDTRDVSWGFRVVASPALAPTDSGYRVQGPIRDKWVATGGAGGTFGPALNNEQTTHDQRGRYNRFRNGYIYWSPNTGAHTISGCIWDKWASLGSERGGLGYPTTDETETPDKVGRYNQFEGGAIYWTPRTGACVVMVAIRDKWASLNWENGFLGYPTTDETGTPDGVGRYAHFDGGSIYWTEKTGAQTVTGAIRDKWASLGWERSALGYALSQRCRKKIEEGIGWIKTVAGLARSRWVGRWTLRQMAELAAAAYNLVRMRKLIPA